MEPRETPFVGFWDRPQGELLAALRSIVRFFGNPLIIVLLVASAVSLSLGDRVGGLIIIAMVFLQRPAEL